MSTVTDYTRFFTSPELHTGLFKEVRYLLIGHKFNGRLRGDLQHVDTVSSPQRRWAALL